MLFLKLEMVCTFFIAWEENLKNEKKSKILGKSFFIDTFWIILIDLIGDWTIRLYWNSTFILVERLPQNMNLISIRLRTGNSQYFSPNSVSRIKSCEERTLYDPLHEMPDLCMSILGLVVLFIWKAGVWLQHLSRPDSCRVWDKMSELSGCECVCRIQLCTAMHAY